MWLLIVSVRLLLLCILLVIVFVYLVLIFGGVVGSLWNLNCLEFVVELL